MLSTLFVLPFCFFPILLPYFLQSAGQVCHFAETWAVFTKPCRSLQINPSLSFKREIAVYIALMKGLKDILLRIAHPISPIFILL